MFQNCKKFKQLKKTSETFFCNYFWNADYKHDIALWLSLVNVKTDDHKFLVVMKIKAFDREIHNMSLQ